MTGISRQRTANAIFTSAERKAKMRRHLRIILILIISLSLTLAGCYAGPGPGTSGTGETLDGSQETTPSQESADAPHLISLSELTGLLSESGQRTNAKSFWLDDGASYHGGQQMRVVHTERGTYAAFAKDFGGSQSGGIQKYYVVKADKDGNTSIIHYGQFTSDTNEVLVNIGQDTSGDILVTVASFDDLAVLVFDRYTDEMTIYRTSPVFHDVRPKGYSQTMFDFENRMIYAFYNGTGSPGYGNGDYSLEWFAFDMEKKEWAAQSTYAFFRGIGRHCYLYPFPDGKGGAYILSNRDYVSNEVDLIEGPGVLSVQGDRIYLWDQLDLFYIKDLNSSDGIEVATVHRAYTEKGAEGIWSIISNNLFGDVFVDSDGHMHITYQYRIYDPSGDRPDLDDDLQYRHAVYDGLECVFNEEIRLGEEHNTNYRPMVRECPDGSLCLIAAVISGERIEFEFYRAGDALGKSWEPAGTQALEEGITTNSLSLSGKRDGSVQDGVLSCFFYGYRGFDRTAFTFDISLEDFSMTEPADLLEGYGIQIDWRYDERIPYYDHTVQTIRNGDTVTAAFVYSSDLSAETDYFHILRIKNGKAEILFSGSFRSAQDRYLTMKEGPDGTVYVCPPTGYDLYTVDPGTGDVAQHNITLLDLSRRELTPQQADLCFDPDSGSGYYMVTMIPEYFGISLRPFDSENMKVPFRNSVQSFDADAGSCVKHFVLEDGKGGVYMVGTRRTGRSSGAELSYEGHVQYVDDSVILFHIPDLSSGSDAEIEHTVVQPPYTEEGENGVWSSVRVKDVSLDTDGRLRIIYSYCLTDLDDADRRGLEKMTAETLKYCLAVYDGTEQLSLTEIGAEGLDADSSVRLFIASDGTEYLITCNLQRSYGPIYTGRYPEGCEAAVTVFMNEEGGWTPVFVEKLGDFAAEGLIAGKPFDGGDGSDCADLLIYGSDNEVHYTRICFEKNN